MYYVNLNKDMDMDVKRVWTTGYPKYHIPKG